MAEERRPRVQFLSDMKVKVHIHKESPIDALQEAVAIIKSLLLTESQLRIFH